MLNTEMYGGNDIMICKAAACVVSGTEFIEILFPKFIISVCRRECDGSSVDAVDYGNSGKQTIFVLTRNLSIHWNFDVVMIVRL